MNQINDFNRTLEYLEKCLDGEINENTVSCISGYSYPLFARVFSIIANMTLSEYLRCRKLTKAAVEIANTDTKIIDIAFKYGYESQSSFTTSFKNFHKVTPGDVRRGYRYNIFTPIHFSLSIEGGNKMEVKIEKKNAFSIAGLSLKSGESDDFSRLWDELFDTKGIDLLLKIGSGQSYGACFDVKDDKDFSYMAGFDVKNKELAKSKGLEILDVPETDYAIIPLKGKVPECILKGWKYVLGTFLPENGLKHVGTPDFEVYPEGDMQSDEYEMELWVPVEKQ